MKQEYHVKAGGKVTDILIEFEGIKRLNITEQGQLEIETKGGILREDLPFSYQIINGKKVEVDVSYIIDEENKNMVRFKAEKFQKDRELVIDPAMVYSTFLGGDHFDYCYEIEIDQYGNAYALGYTQSSAFPTTSGAYDTTSNGDYDGDGKTDVAVWRPSNGWRYLRGIGGSSWRMAGDIPVPGNYDGDIDGTTDIAVWSPSNGRWYIMGSGGYIWGMLGDIPLVR